MNVRIVAIDIEVELEYEGLSSNSAISNVRDHYDAFEWKLTRMVGRCILHFMKHKQRFIAVLEMGFILCLRKSRWNYEREWHLYEKKEMSATAIPFGSECMLFC